MTVRRIGIAGGAAAAIVVAPGPASAHLIGVEFGEFYAGALHMLLDFEQIAVLVALALAAAAQPLERARWALAGLPIGLLAGAALGVATRGGAPESALIAASLALAGALGAAALRMPSAFIAGLAAAVGAALGYLNGVSAHEAPVDWRLYGAGVVAAGLAAGSLLIAIASVAASWRRWTGVAGRVLSSWAAAAGLLGLGLAVAG